jgi:murein DD-endopeptidase MepM/ murein hydrolase activator NlpD
VIRREPIPVEAAPAPSLPEPTVRRTELPPPAPAYTPPPKPVATVVTTVAGAVVSVPGKPQVRVVESGDALDAIARGFGSTRAELIKLNDLEPPYRLKLGQKIKGPASEPQKAYVVGQGDTMFAIAKRFNVTQAALADENDLKSGAAIKKGQKLLLPEGFKDKGPTKTTVMMAQAGSSSTALAGASPPPAARPSETPRATTPASTASSPFGSSGSTTTTSLSVTGSVVSVTGPRQVYTVKSGDTLTAIAKRFDMSVKEVADANDLDSDKPLRLGAKIKGPATTSKAYVATSSDTLTAIAKRFNVSVKELAAENDLKTSASVKKGQKIVLPDGYKDKGPIKTTTTTPNAPSRTYAEAPAPTPSQPAAVTPSAPIPYKPSNAQPAAPPTSSYPRPTGPVAAMPTTPPASTARPIIESSAAPTEAEIIASGRGKFSWPLRGEIISDFGVKGTGQRNDGLNIRAAAGHAVVSAADGEIAYAGNQVPSFGNFVLVKHADGWVTAYAYLGQHQRQDAADDVRKGEQLGAVGATGGANEPQLHFEMRYRAYGQGQGQVRSIRGWCF